MLNPLLKFDQFMLETKQLLEIHVPRHGIRVRDNALRLRVNLIVVDGGHSNFDSKKVNAPGNAQFSDLLSRV